MRFFANNWRVVAAVLSIVAFAVSGTAGDPNPM
jgi:hypothetical protein